MVMIPHPTCLSLYSCNCDMLYIQVGGDGVVDLPVQGREVYVN